MAGQGIGAGRTLGAADIAGRSNSFLAAEAISEYLDVNETQVSGIRDAIASLDRGAAVSHEKVHEWVLSWDSQQEQPIPRPYEHRMVE